MRLAWQWLRSSRSSSSSSWLTRPSIRTAALPVPKPTSLRYALYLFNNVLEWTKIWLVLVIPMPEKIVSERRSGLRPSGKELPQRRSVTKMTLLTINWGVNLKNNTCKKNSIMNCWYQWTQLYIICGQSEGDLRKAAYITVKQKRAWFLIRTAHVTGK
jgi:hypothetical protein